MQIFILKTEKLPLVLLICLEWFLLMASGCTKQGTISIDKSGQQLLTVGSLLSKNKWVYLSGLTDDFWSQAECKNRKKLDKVGKKLNICFLAIRPMNRDVDHANMLCWPHNSAREINTTYQQIRTILKDNKVCGWLGFSNGGFFLNQLIQYIELQEPVVSICASGYLHQAPFKNTLYLLTGKQDFIHAELVRNLYKQLLTSPIKAKLIEYQGGHEIVASILKATLKQILISEKY